MDKSVAPHRGDIVVCKRFDGGFELKTVVKVEMNGTPGAESIEQFDTALAVARACVDGKNRVWMQTGPKTFEIPWEWY